MFQQPFEELVTLSFSPCQYLLLPADLSGFLAWSHDLREERSCFRVTDPNRFKLEQVEILWSVLIQPSDDSHMLRARIGHDPNRPTCLDADEIREQLPKVVMIAFLQLVLDNNRLAIFVFRDKIYAEGARGLLPLYTA